MTTHVAVTFDFHAAWKHFSPFPLNNAEFSTSKTAQTTAPTQQLGIGELTLDANELEVKYWIVSQLLFPPSL